MRGEKENMKHKDFISIVADDDFKRISEEFDFHEAVRKYEKIVAPSNYKRPKTIFTQKMLEDAKKKLEELGLVDALERKEVEE